MDDKNYLLLIFLFIGYAMSGQGVQFVGNQGQWSDDVFFKSVSHTSSVTLGKDYLAFTIFENTHSHTPEIAEEIKTPKVIANWAVRFENVNNVIPEAADTLVTKYNFLVGSDSNKWRSNVPSCSRVIYKDLYPNIDLLVYSNSQGIKYDFIVRPQGDQSDISWSYVGVDPQLKNGEIVLIDSLGVVETKPLVYQIENSKVKQIDAEYLFQSNRFTYGVGDFNPNLNLVIDPEIVWSTYGLPSQLEAYTVRADGKSILMGFLPYSFQSDWPGIEPVPGSISFFSAIQCLYTDGSQLEWVSLVGSSTGSFPVDVAEAENGLLCNSRISSNDFPMLENGYQNQVVGLSSTALYLLSDDGDAVISSTVVDFPGIFEYSYSSLFFSPLQSVISYESDLVLHGSTDSGFLLARTIHGDVSNLPLTNGFGGNSGSYVEILEIDFSLQQLNWLITLGNEPNDCICQETFLQKCGLHIGDLTVLQNGSIALCGWAFCPGFPTTENVFDTTFGGEREAWIAVLSSEGQLEAFTYFGGIGNEEATIIIESENGVLVGGRSDGSMEVGPSDLDFGQSIMIWLAEFNMSLSSLQWFATGGPNSALEDIDYDVAISNLVLDTCGNIICSLQHQLPCYPFCTDFSLWNLTDDAFQNHGPSYLFKINKMANVVSFASTFGGGFNHWSKNKRLMNGKLYFGVCVETTSGLSDEIIVGTENAFNPNITGLFQGSMTVFQFPDSLSGHIQSVPTIVEVEETCGSVNVQLQSPENGDVTWLFGDGESEVENYNPLHSYNQMGEYTIALIVSDPSTCNGSDTSYVTVSVPAIISEPQASLSFDEFDPCVLPQVITFSAEATNASSLFWLGSNGQSSSNGQFEYTIQQAGEHEVWLEVSNEVCDTVLQLSTTISLYNPIEATLNYTLLNESACEGAEVYAVVDGTGFESVLWTDSEGASETTTEFQNHYEPGIYEISAALFSEHCDDLTLSAFPEIFGEEPFVDFQFPNVFSPQSDGTNDKLYLPSDLVLDLSSFSLVIFNRWGQKVFETVDANFRWDGMFNGEMLKEGTYSYISKFNHPCVEGLIVKTGTINIVR